MKLRDYQASATERVHSAWQKQRRALLVMPTGSGKTITGVAIVGSRRALWVAHSRELVKQAANAFRANGISVSSIMAGESTNYNAQVLVGTVQSIDAIDSDKLRGRDVVLDEAHHYPDSNHWGTVRHKCPNANLLGLTATPERRDGEPMGDVFDEMIVGVRPSELFARGILVKPALYAPPKSQGSNLAIDPVDAVERYCQGRGAFVFVPRVEVADGYQRRLVACGIRAAVISYRTKRLARDAAMGEFSAGRLDALISVDALTEGVDVPRASACVIARSYSHPSQLIQSTGRITRPHPEKSSSIILDLTGVTRRLGVPYKDCEYSLSETPIVISEAEEREPRDMPVRQEPCPQQITGASLLPVDGAPPIPSAGPGVQNADISAWGSFLSLAIRDGLSKREAAAAFRSERGSYPPGYVVT